MSTMQHDEHVLSFDATHQHDTHSHVSLLLVDGCSHCPDCNGSVGAVLNAAMLPVLMLPVPPVAQLHNDGFASDYYSRLYRPPLV